MTEKTNKDVLGWRRKFGVLGPSTNTIVQPDFDDMRPPGVTNHYSRIFTENAHAVSNETFMAGTQVISGNVLDAVKSVMTCDPNYLVMGMSAFLRARKISLPPLLKSLVIARSRCPVTQPTSIVSAMPWKSLQGRQAELTLHLRTPVRDCRQQAPTMVIPPNGKA